MFSFKCVSHRLKFSGEIIFNKYNRELHVLFSQMVGEAIHWMPQNIIKCDPQKFFLPCAVVSSAVRRRGFIFQAAIAYQLYLDSRDIIFPALWGIVHLACFLGLAGPIARPGKCIAPHP